MNATSRAILQTVVATDTLLSSAERGAVQRLIDGEVEVRHPVSVASDGPLLVTQKRAAEMLSVSRITIWRMAKDAVLHPVEILPGTWRYPCDEILALVRRGSGAEESPDESRQKSAA